MEDRAVGLEVEAEITPPTSDMARLGDGRTALAGLRAVAQSEAPMAIAATSPSPLWNE